MVIRPLRLLSGGFTFIELMLVLVILGVLAALALPSMRNFVATSQVRSTASDLRASLARARSEAMLRNANVNVVPMSGNWSNGWQVQSGGVVLEEHGALQRVTTSPTVAPTVTYRLDGRISAGSQSVVIVPADAPAIRARCVYIDSAGRPVVRVDKDTDATNGCE